MEHFEHNQYITEMVKDCLEAGTIDLLQAVEILEENDLLIDEWELV